MLLVLGSPGLNLSLLFWLLTDPRVITAVIVKETPNGRWSRGPAALPAAGPAGWIAARLGSSVGLRWSPAGLLLRSLGGFRWSTAGLVKTS
jgi:hypothetical protein